MRNLLKHEKEKKTDTLEMSYCQKTEKNRKLLTFVRRINQTDDNATYQIIWT